MNNYYEAVCIIIACVMFYFGYLAVGVFFVALGAFSAGFEAGKKEEYKRMIDTAIRGAE